MTRILVISDEPAGLNAGAEAQLLGRHWQLSGCEVSYLWLGGKGQPCNNGASNNNELQVVWRRRFCATAWRLIIGRCRAFQPDEIHVWGKHAPIVATVLSQATRVPVKFVVESLRELLRSARFRLPRRWPGRAVPFVRSEPLRQKWLESGERQRGATGVLPWFALTPGEPPAAARDSLLGEDARNEVRDRLGIPAGCWLAGTAAELVPRARIKDFMWAIDLMCCARDDVYGIVIGDGPQEWRLRRYASQLATGEHLNIMTGQPGAAQLVSALDVYVQPSEWFDDYRGLRTALACGIPVVAASRSFPAELLRHRSSGYAVARGARNEIARCINRIVNEPDVAREFSSGAQLLGQSLATVSEAAESMLGDAAGVDHLRKA